MNQLFLNISIVSLVSAPRYSISPLFSSTGSNFAIKNLNFFKSFSHFAFNIQNLKLFDSTMAQFLQAPIKIDNEAIKISGTFYNVIYLEDFMQSTNEIVIENCKFGNSVAGISYLSDKPAKINISATAFLRCSNDSPVKITGDVNFFMSRTCFTSVSGALDLNLLSSNTPTIKESTFSDTRNSMTISISTSSIVLTNINTTDKDSYRTEKSFSFTNCPNLEVTYFTHLWCSAQYALALKNVAYSKIHNINIIENGFNGNGQAAIRTQSGVYTFYSSTFHIFKQIALSFSSYVNFVQCFSNQNFFNVHTENCYTTIFGSPLFGPIILVDCDQADLSEPKKAAMTVETIGDRPGSGQIIGGLLIAIVLIGIIVIVVWLIVYFAVLRNPLTAFQKDDDESRRWAKRWNWIIKFSKTGQHCECSDIEIDPIERSEEAVQRKKREESIDPLLVGENAEAKKADDDKWQNFLKNQGLDEPNSPNSPNSMNSSIEPNTQISRNTNLNESGTNIFGNEGENNANTGIFMFTSSIEETPSSSPPPPPPPPPKEEEEKHESSIKKEEDETRHIEEEEESTDSNQRKARSEYGLLMKTGVDKTLGKISSESDTWDEKTTTVPTVPTNKSSIKIKPIMAAKLKKLKPDDEDDTKKNNGGNKSDDDDTWSLSQSGSTSLTASWSDEGDSISSSFSD